MRQVILVFAALAVVAIGVIAFAEPDEQPLRKQPTFDVVYGYGSGHIAYRIDDENHRFLASFPPGWNCTSQSTTGGSNGYYRTQATFADGANSVSVNVQRDSMTSSRVLIDGNYYDLSNGSVFRLRAVKAPGAAAKVEVTQIPFAPLEVSPPYVDQLNMYFEAREKQ